MRPPFHANLPDALHCHPACVRMAVEALSGRVVSWAEAERLTGFQPGRLTWHQRSYVECAALGLGVEVVEDMEHEAFAADPMGFLRARFGDADARAIGTTSDVFQAARDTRTLLDRPDVTLTSRVPGLADLDAALARGALALCGVNRGRLHGGDDGADHSVLIYGARDGAYLCHDPGPPPFEALAVPRARFEHAWSWPTPRDRGLFLLSR